MRQFKQNITGQGMTEYIIIVALIAIAAIGVFTGFGDIVRNQVGVMAGELAGDSNAAARTAVETGAATAETGSNARTLSDFENGN
ncbi:MAG: hypothetical protein ACPGSC_03290 [Granulosicoccaceae bacterium]